MAQTVTLNGVSYQVPDVGDAPPSVNWGQNLTDFFVALPNAVLQKTGGAFNLTSELDFGSSFGVKSLYFKSRGTNPATTGAVRLSNLDGVSWRNNANSANLALTANASDELTFNSTKVLLSGAVVNADISGAAAIAYAKLALTNSIVNGDISASAAIAYSKLNLATSIVNADISGTASIAYGKLNLSASIVNADIAGAAAIAWNKMAALAGNLAMFTTAGGVVTTGTTTATELGYLSGVTSAIQTQIDARVVDSGDTMTGDLTFANQAGVVLREQTGNGTNSVKLVAPDAVTATITLKLPDGVGSSGQFLRTDGTGVLSWVNPAGGGTVSSGTQYRLTYYAATGTTVSEAAAITASRALVSDANGVPTHSAVTTTELGYVSGVTSAIQTQIAAKAPTASPTFTGAVGINAAASGADILRVYGSGSTNVLIESSTDASPGYSIKNTAREWNVSNRSDGRLYFRDNTGSGERMILSPTGWLAVGPNATYVANCISIRTDAAESAGLYVRVNNATGDPFVQFTTNSTDWVMGPDNSDSDKFKLSRSGNIGTDDIFELDSNKRFWLTGGNLQVSRNNGGSDVNAFIANTDNSAGSSASILLEVGGTSASDPYMTFRIPGGTSWSIGADNSLSDQFSLNKATTVGNNRYMYTDGDGSVVFPFLGGVSVETDSAGNYSVLYIQNKDNTNGNSHAALLVSVAGTSGGDPTVRFTVTGGSPASWAIGVDNSDSDKFKINNASTLSTGSTLEINSSNQLMLLDGSNTAPTYSFINDPNTGMYSNGADEIAWTIGGTKRMVLGQGPSLFPATDNAVNLGNSSFRWGNVYAASGTINTSHSSFKHDIRDIQDVRVPRGVYFRWNEETGSSSERLVMGFLADDLQREAFDWLPDGTIDKKAVHTNAVLGNLCAGWWKHEHTITSHEARIQELENELIRLRAA